MPVINAPEARERGWPEDWPYENGEYLCQCRECGKVFIGYKRRVVCKPCSEPDTGFPGGQTAMGAG